MYKFIKKTTLHMSALIAAASLVTVALGNTNILAQSCLNGDGVNCNTQSPNPPSTPPAPTVKLVASRTIVQQNEPVTLTWTVTSASSCTASVDWSGSKSASGGSQIVTVPRTSTYTITCTGSGGSASSSVVVTGSADPSASATLSLSARSSTVVPEPGTITFTVTRSGSDQGPLSVPWNLFGKGQYDYSISLFTDAHKEDFQNSITSGVVNLAQGENSQTFTVNVIHDQKFEYEREGYTICISAPANATVNPSARCADGEILDKDAYCEYPVSTGLAWFIKVACIIAVLSLVGFIVTPTAILVLLPMAVIATAAWIISPVLAFFGFPSLRDFAQYIYNILYSTGNTLSYQYFRPIKTLEPLWTLPPF